VTEEKQAWLTEPYDYERPRRGQIRQGVILQVEERGVTVDIGLKREGFVPDTDIKRLGKDVASQLEPGQEVTACIVQPEDRDGNLILSLRQAQIEKDWTRAQEMLESSEIWQGQVNGYNRGGLVVKFGRIRAFVPGSHLAALSNRRLPSDRREEKFREYIGQELSLKVIEVDQKEHRLVLSERLARKQMREQHKERLLNELFEGQVCQGTVTRICNFGAFVDLGGADGLIHISELGWRRVRHPREVLQVGDEVEVYVLRLDHERKRIGLSLKRLQPDPWSQIDLTHTRGQLVSGVVTHVVDFGAFVALDVGVEGLIHISELADPPPQEPREIVRRGDELVLRVLRIEPSRRRIGLSLRSVTAQERDEWLAQHTLDQTAELEGTASVPLDRDQPYLPGEEQALPVQVDRVTEMTSDVIEQTGGQVLVEATTR
jgi:small subunit ribosomal protein S1